MYYEVLYGTQEDASTLMRRLEGGKMLPPIDVEIDASSVYDAISAKDTATPQEAALRLHVISIKDRIRCHELRSLGWVDAGDMIADGLTKGGVDRT